MNIELTLTAPEHNTLLEIIKKETDILLEMQKTLNEHKGKRKTVNMLDSQKVKNAYIKYLEKNRTAEMNDEEIDDSDYTIQDALWKQFPVLVKYNESNNKYYCSVCGNQLRSDVSSYHHCSKCGQRLNWTPRDIKAKARKLKEA